VIHRSPGALRPPTASVKHICGNVIKQGRFGHNASHFPLKVAQGH
jgi:hypothetical protein